MRPRTSARRRWPRRRRGSRRSIRTCASKTLAARVGPAELAPLVARADVVLDCSDNFATRHAVNRACVAAGTPLVSGAAIRFDGQIAVFDPRDAASPCYHCLFGEGEELEATRCAVMGVFAPVVGIVGATQAAEALKLIAGVGETAGRAPAAARRVRDALARGPRSARSAMPGVREAMMPARSLRARAGSIACAAGARCDGRSALPLAGRPHAPRRRAPTPTAIPCFPTPSGRAIKAHRSASSSRR